MTFNEYMMPCVSLVDFFYVLGETANVSKVGKIVLQNFKTNFNRGSNLLEKLFIMAMHNLSMSNE